MKCTFTILIAAYAAISLSAQQTPGYEMAERFSAKKVSQMVHSTRIDPNWFQDSDRFWYKWEDSEGTQYYIVDAKTGRKTPVFDMDAIMS